MKTWRLINLGLFVACMVGGLVSKNYTAAAGWFCASILQLSFISGENDE